MLKCAVCGAVKSDETKLFQCSSCKSVAYCSVDHQKQDWPNHRKSCKLVSVQIQQVEIEPENRNGSEKEFKTVAVASRDFKQGEIILDEKPLFTIPVSHCCGPALTSFDRVDIQTDLSMWGIDTSVRDLQCVVCGVLVKPHQKCSTCSAPICSHQCEEASLHATNECAVLSSGSRPLKFGKHSGGEKNCPMKQVILMRIAKAKENQPEVWEAVRNLLGPKKFTDDYKMLEWIMENRGFSHIDITVSETGDHFSKTEGSMAKITCIYKIGSQIEHSCAPNCDMSLGPFPDFKMRVWAAVPIKKGEILNISLLPNQVAHQGTLIRREAIRRYYNNICQCKLCRDVTEGGTFQSAVTCTKCRDSPAQSRKQDEDGQEGKKLEGKLPGYLLPVNSEPGSKWKCGGCGLEKSEHGIMTFFQRMKQFINPRDPFGFADSQSGRVLHPNHFHIHNTLSLHLGVKTWGVLKQGGSSTVDSKEFERLMETTKYVLNIYDKTQPGVTSSSAPIQLFAAGVLHGMLNAILPAKIPSVGRTNKLLKMAEECEDYLRKGLLFHQLEIAEKDYKRQETVQKIMQRLEQLKGIKQKILQG